MWLDRWSFRSAIVREVDGKEKRLAGCLKETTCEPLSIFHKRA
jgi:hypothetical protein